MHDAKKILDPAPQLWETFNHYAKIIPKNMNTRIAIEIDKKLKQDLEIILKKAGTSLKKQEEAIAKLASKAGPYHKRDYSKFFLKIFFMYLDQFNLTPEQIWEHPLIEKNYNTIHSIFIREIINIFKKNARKNNHTRNICLPKFYKIKTFRLPEIFTDISHKEALPENLTSHAGLQCVPCTMKNMDFPDAINFSGNQIFHMPNYLGYKTNLITINFSNNLISHIPETVKYLKYLKKLDLSQNKIFYIPDALNQMAALSDLNLSHNQLHEKSFPKLTLKSLKKLNLSNNFLSDYSNTFQQLTNLTDLDLNHNLNLKHITCPTSSFKNLKFVNYHGTKLTNVPTIFEEKNILNIFYELKNATKVTKNQRVPQKNKRKIIWLV